MLETDGSLYKRNTLGREMRVITFIQPEGIASVKPKSGIPVVKSTRPCRCDYDEVKIVKLQQFSIKNR